MGLPSVQTVALAMGLGEDATGGKVAQTAITPQMGAAG
jgi:hypothetical protein